MRGSVLTVLSLAVIIKITTALPNHFNQSGDRHGDSEIEIPGLKDSILKAHKLTEGTSKNLLNPLDFEKTSCNLDSTYFNQLKRIWLHEDFHLPDQEQDRVYRAIELNNGIIAILISDNSTEKSAMSISVNVGSFSDPDQLPGLAHFLEHMLFLGTTKYPNPAEYLDFIKSNGGRRNAFTSSLETNYYFEIGHKALFEGMERLVDFFVNPLFSEESIEKELIIIESEHSKNLKNDARRLNQALKNYASSPYNKFTTGNLKTLKHDPEKLGLNPRQETIDFYKKWYSANLISASVFGSEDIEEMTKKVIDELSKIENRHKAPPSLRQIDLWSSPEFLRQTYFFQTIDEKKQLVIRFTLPSLDYKYQKVSSIVNHILGHEGEGTLFAFLQKNDLAIALSSSIYSYQEGGQRISQCKITLTDAGMNNYLQIIEYFFEYIAMMKAKLPIPESIWQESKDYKAMQFKFMSKNTKTMKLVRDISSALHSPEYQEAPEKIMSLGIEYPQYDQQIKDLIAQHLNYYSIDRATFILNAKNFENISGFNISTLPLLNEDIYGSKYQMKPHSEELISKINQIDSWNPEFDLPKPNNFIPDDFSIIYDEDENQDLEDVFGPSFSDKESVDFSKVSLKVCEPLFPDDEDSEMSCQNVVANLEANQTLTSADISEFYNRTLNHSNATQPFNDDLFLFKDSNLPVKITNESVVSAYNYVINPESKNPTWPILWKSHRGLIFLKPHMKNTPEEMKLIEEQPKTMIKMKLIFDNNDYDRDDLNLTIQESMTVHYLENLFDEGINTFKYGIQYGGISINVKMYVSYLYIQIYGYNQKQDIILEKLYEYLDNFSKMDVINQEKIDKFGAAYIEYLHNAENEAAYKTGIDSIKKVTNIHYIGNNDILTWMEDNAKNIFTEEYFLNYVENQLFSRINGIKAFFGGNLDVHQVKKIVDMTYDLAIKNGAKVMDDDYIATAEEPEITTQPTVEDAAASVQKREIETNQKDHQIEHDDEDESDEEKSWFIPFYNKNAIISESIQEINAMTLFIQNDVKTVESYAINFLYSKMINSEFFYDLRSRQSLGYVVHVGPFQFGNRVGTIFIIQGAEDPKYLHFKTLEFINTRVQSVFDAQQQIDYFDEKLQKNVTNFQSFKETLGKSINKPLFTQGALNKRLWNEITTSRFDFDRSKDVDEFIRSDNVTLQTMIDYHNGKILNHTSIIL